MRFSPLSFLIGLAAAWALPVVAKSFRSLAVEATVTGLALMDEARRVIAEQREQLEDIAAEAQARRDERQAAADAEPEPADLADSDDGEPDSQAAGNGDAAAGARPRRRGRRTPTAAR
jgi:hypothetical protein